MDVVPSKRKTTAKMWQDQWDLFASYLYLWVCIGARQIHYWDSALRNGSIWLVFRNFFVLFWFSFSCCYAVALWFANLPYGINLNCLKQIPLKPLFPFKLTLQICCAWISTHFENSMKINLFKMNCSLMKYVNVDARTRPPCLCMYFSLKMPISWINTSSFTHSSCFTLNS